MRRHYHWKPNLTSEEVVQLASTLPPNVAIEPIFVIEATYAQNAEELRRPVRAQHLARAADLRDQGIILEGGAFADLSGSLLLVRAPDEEAALAIVRDDVYTTTGVWAELRVRAFGRLVRPGELPAG